MVERSLPIINKLGLHARAAAKVVQLTGKFKSSIFALHRGREINAKSIMGLMMLAAGKGSEIYFRAEGPDELAILDALESLFARRFDEDE